MKKERTPEELYKYNQKKAKIFKILSPLVFWGFLIVSMTCLVFALRNSFGNVSEIMTLLDGDKYTEEQIAVNYTYLIEKYGEWVIGNIKGFKLTFIDIGNALFSGLMIVNCIMAVVFFFSAFILGKWILPMLANQMQTENQDMVNLTVLRNAKKE